jgi:hypothetical protein
MGSGCNQRKGNLRDIGGNMTLAIGNTMPKKLFDRLLIIARKLEDLFERKKKVGRPFVV